MALSGNGRSALLAILEHGTLFPRIKDADFVGVAGKLARKQLTAAGLTRDDLLKLKETLGEAVFDKTLDSLSPYHIKLLAKRLDKNAPEIEVNTGSSALSYVRQILSGDIAITTASTAETEVPAAVDTPPKKNKYLGRKAFRTGR